MGKYLVADTYAPYEQVGEPFEKNGKPYIIVKETCSKCIYRTSTLLCRN